MRSKITQALRTLKQRLGPFVRSATVYVGLLIAAMPDLAPLIQAHLVDLEQFIPKAWLDPSMRLIGILVLIARARTLIKTRAQEASE